MIISYHRETKTMNKFYTICILFACVVSAYCAVTKDKEWAGEVAKNETVAAQGVEQLFNSLMDRFSSFLSKKDDEINKADKPKDDETELKEVDTNSTRSRRQLLPPNRLGPQFPDGGMNSQFPDFYDFYPNDFLYDYYDWVCSDTLCQLCNILTSECCDPSVNVNCFLPDSCLNNPCLSGGTCIPTQTLDQRADFICVCYPGFTGKYCQLTNEFFFPPPPMQIPVPVPAPVQNFVQQPYFPPPQPPRVPQYAPPAPQYAPQPQPQFAPQPPRYVQPPQQFPLPTPPKVQQYAQPQPQPQLQPMPKPQSSYGGQSPMPMDRQ